MLCTRHHAEELEVFDHAPVGQGHTRFHVFVCRNCREVDFFPDVNYALVDRDFRRALEVRLTSLGLIVKHPVARESER